MAVAYLWHRRLACGSIRVIAGPKNGSRTFGYGKLGNSVKLYVIMSPGKTVSKLRSTSAPYLAQAPAPKLGVGIDLNRCRDRVGCLLGPDTVLTRSRPHRGADATELSPGRKRCSSWRLSSPDTEEHHYAHSGLH